MRKRTIVCFIALMFSTTLAHAHSFWINAFKQRSVADQRKPQG
ncbi:hypothetical protein [Desulfosarcina ovata]|nr:hypothetical protein [Desulfosarcina ovata]